MSHPNAPEFRQHAIDCEELAATAKSETDRDRYAKMAAAWTKLADNEVWLSYEGSEHQTTYATSASHAGM